ncbi:MAG: hypothetical protein NUV91_09635 [Candidatus Omnitrophica bacterium]|nr:hypothetical protein [Candidatus Omnitrophota bacterium]
MNPLNKYTLGILTLVLTCSGCATAIEKVSQRDVSMPVTEATNHTKDVINDYGFDIEQIAPEDGATHVKGEHVDGQTVRVEITPVSDETSHIKVEVTDKKPRTSAKTILEDIAVRYE